MKKRFLSILLSVSIIAMLLTGCGASKEAVAPAAPAEKTEEAPAAEAEEVTEEVAAEEAVALAEPTELKTVVFNSMIAHIDSIVAQNESVWSSEASDELAILLQKLPASVRSNAKHRAHNYFEGHANKINKKEIDGWFDLEIKGHSV